MTDVRELCAHLALDDSAIREALAADGERRAQEMPWYVKGVLGIAAWIASVLVVAFGMFLAASLFASWEDADPFILIGLVFLAVGIWMLRRAKSFFQEQLSTAIALAGIGLAGCAVALLADHLTVAALAVSGLAALGIALTRDGIFQALSGTLAVSFVLVALLDTNIPALPLWLALPLPTGCWLLTSPPLRKDLRPLAVVLLFAAPLALLWTDPGLGLATPQAQDWVPWLARLTGIATACYILWAGVRPARSRAILMVAALLIGIVLPPAGSAGLAILALAFVMGSRLLAVGGIIVTGYVLTAFYYDLGTTLLMKSGMLVLAGCVLTGAWFLLGRKDGAR